MRLPVVPAPPDSVNPYEPAAPLSGTAPDGACVPLPPAGAWAAWPAALRRELRTDHAGEAGAVMIYRGVLAVAHDATLRAFAQHHLETESRHLALIETVVPPSGRSRLLPLWRVAGWLTGAIPACFGPRTVYATIEAVETFVDTHYAAQLVQIDALAPGAGAPVRASLEELREQLAACQQDELVHRDDARARRGEVARTGLRAALTAAWTWIVGAGSAGAVRVSRWV